MARSSTSFGKGQGGRKRGTKNVVPTTFKTTLLGIYQHLQDTRPELFLSAVTKGLELDAPQNFAYVQLWAHYTLGKPIERHEHSGEIRMPTKVIVELHRD